MRIRIMLFYFIFTSIAASWGLALPGISREMENSSNQVVGSKVNVNGFETPVIGYGLRMKELYWKFVRSKSAKEISAPYATNSTLVAFSIENLSTDKAIIMGGYLPDRLKEYDSRRTWIWDIAHDTVIPGPNMCEPRNFAASLTLRNGAILITSGSNGKAIQSSCEVMRPGGKFEIIGTLKIPRDRHTAAEIKPNQIIVVAGQNTTNYAREVELLDLSNGKIRTKQIATLKIGRVDTGIAKADSGEVVIFGGQNFEDSNALSMERVRLP